MMIMKKNRGVVSSSCFRRVVMSSFLLILLLLISTKASGETMEVREALIRFIQQISPGNNNNLMGWNMDLDPCEPISGLGEWEGVVCGDNQVIGIYLDHRNLNGTLNATSLCTTSSLGSLNLAGNNISGSLPEDISRCSNLWLLDISGNSFNGTLPRSLSQMNSLTILDVSNNEFVGELPQNLTMNITGLFGENGLYSFHAENNRFSGEIPKSFGECQNLGIFNVSNNNLSGPIPPGLERFGDTSFSGNPGLFFNASETLSTGTTAPAPAFEPAPADSPRSSAQRLLSRLPIILAPFILIAG